MTAAEPKVEDYGRYDTKAVCDALEIHRNTLSNYTTAGIIKYGIRKNGRKFYIGIDIKKLWKGNY